MVDLPRDETVRLQRYVNKLFNNFSRSVQEGIDEIIVYIVMRRYEE